MKRILFICCSSLLIIACGDNQKTQRRKTTEADLVEQKDTVAQKSVVASEDTIGAESNERKNSTGMDSWVLNDNQGNDAFLLEVDGESGILHILDGEGNPVQVIALQTDEPIEYEVPKHFIDTSDYNFDGHPDFSYRVTGGSGVNWYQYYIYNPATGKFVHHKYLSDRPAVYVDKGKGVLVSTSSSMAGAEYFSKVYKPEGLLNLTLVKEISQVLLDDKGMELHYEEKTFTSEAEIWTCKMDILVEGQVERHCILKGDGCPTGFIALVGTDDQEVELVEGPCE